MAKINWRRGEEQRIKNRTELKNVKDKLLRLQQSTNEFKNAKH